MSSSDSDANSGQGANGDQPTGRENGIRIIADKKKNALLIIATDAEYATIEAALHKLDILPLQVLIEATIAEVTLNDTLQYGTQFFFASGRNSVGLTNASSNPTVLGSQIPNNQAFSGILAPEFPAFSIARTLGSAQFAIQALKSVTDVKVVSSPKLLVLDNEKARLQVGDLVPVITQSATAVSSAGAPVVNSVDYRETGVILTVRPRINAGGLVTLDLEQEVSDVVEHHDLDHQFADLPAAQDPQPGRRPGWRHDRARRPYQGQQDGRQFRRSRISRTSRSSDRCSEPRATPTSAPSCS